MDWLGMGGDSHCARLETIRVDFKCREVVVAREHTPKRRGAGCGDVGTHRLNSQAYFRAPAKPFTSGKKDDGCSMIITTLTVSLIHSIVNVNRTHTCSDISKDRNQFFPDQRSKHGTEVHKHINNITYHSSSIWRRKHHSLLDCTGRPSDR